MSAVARGRLGAASPASMRASVLALAVLLSATAGATAAVLFNVAVVDAGLVGEADAEALIDRLEGFRLRAPEGGLRLILLSNPRVREAVAPIVGLETPAAAGEPTPVAAMRDIVTQWRGALVRPTGDIALPSIESWTAAMEVVSADFAHLHAPGDGGRSADRAVRVALVARDITIGVDGVVVRLRGHDPKVRCLEGYRADRLRPARIARDLDLDLVALSPPSGASFTEAGLTLLMLAAGMERRHVGRWRARADQSLDCAGEAAAITLPPVVARPGEGFCLAAAPAAPAATVPPLACPIPLRPTPPPVPPPVPPSVPPTIPSGQVAQVPQPPIGQGGKPLAGQGKPPPPPPQQIPPPPGTLPNPTLPNPPAPVPPVVAVPTQPGGQGGTQPPANVPPVVQQVPQGAPPPGVDILVEQRPPRLQSGWVVEQNAEQPAYRRVVGLTVGLDRPPRTPLVAVIGPFRVVPADLAAAPRAFLPTIGDHAVADPGTYVVAVVIEPSVAVSLVPTGAACADGVPIEGRVKLLENRTIANRSIRFERRYRVCRTGPVVIDPLATFAVERR